MPRASLRTVLLILVAGAVVPLLAFAAYLTIALSRTQQAAIERGLSETARALASGVERELKSTITPLEALATSRHLDRGDYLAFLAEAQRVLESQTAHGWLTIHLATADGTPLMNSSATSGPLPALFETASVKYAASSGAPVISDLLPAHLRDEPAFAVRVPVNRAGAVKYVLSATLSARAIAGALRSQEHAADRIAVLYDRRGTIVYRTVNPEGLIGTPVTPRLARESADHDSGVLDDVNREGTPVRTVFQRLRTGWSVAVGIPHHVLYAAQRRSLWNVAIVGAGFLTVGAVAVFLVGRHIRRSVGALVATADTLNTPAASSATPAATPITELARLGDALVAARELIRERGAAVERHVAELEVAREAAESGNRAKDEFLAVLSHELRTPLNAVYGWATMLRSGAIQGAAAERALDAIVRNSNVQVELIDDLLDMSRVISGKMRLDVRPVDIKAVVEAALDAVRPSAAAKEIRLESVLDSSAPPMMGDPARLQQIVWNLLTNAVKFTSKRGRVQVHLLRVNSHVEIVISDTGQGIAPEVLPFVFDRFRQADTSSSRAQAGLGLGLALVKHLTELHGGTVLATSAGESKGATFVVRLPLSIAQLPLEPPTRVHPTAATVSPVRVPVRLDGLRVLVVDDDRDALELASAIVQGAGGTVRTSTSAREALRTLPAWRPDVLVSDIEMPGEDGYWLIRQVRALDGSQGGKTPAIAVTAYGRTEDRRMSLGAGYNMHVPKPVDPGELVTIVASLAGRTSPPA